MGALPATPIHDLPAGIERVPLPVPFPVGPVNCYLLVGEPLTLVDPGMVYADTVDRLAGALARVGCRLEDVAQVVVTHGHPDHFGAAGLVASRSGATVVCGREDEAKLRLRFEPGDLLRVAAELGTPAEFASMLAEVRRLGTPTPYQLATRLFPDVAGFEVILALSEVVGHLDLLESEGRLLRTPGSPSRYAAA